MDNEAGNPIRISVSGSFRLFDTTGEEVRLSLIRSNAAIAFLAFSDSNNASRDKLAGMLWSERDNSAALQSLRQVTLQLRNFGKQVEPKLLTITKRDFTLDRSLVSSELDLLDEAISNSNYPDFSTVPDPEQMLVSLDGIDGAFDEWLRNWREDVKERLRAKLANVIAASDIQLGIKTEAAEALHRIDPTHETAARHLIEVEAENKNSAAMLRVYQRLWDALADEWDEEPSADLQEFFVEKRIKLGEGAAPTHQASYLANAHSIQGRREFLSVAVVRISPNNHSTLIDLEEFEELTRHYTNLVVEILNSFGGTTSTGVGGEIFGVFGPLSTEEEDIQNALHAALDINGKLSAVNGDRSVQSSFSFTIGIDTGIVYLRISEDGSMLYDVFGPAISNALEMSRRIQGASVLATEQSVRRLHSVFSFSPEPPVFDGNENVSVVSVIGKHHPSFLLSSEVWHAQNTFVGRSSFLAEIEERWAIACGNQLERIVVLGEPGVGKTRLVSEFLRQRISTGDEAHFVKCRRQDRSAPLEPMYALHESLLSKNIATPTDSASLDQSDGKAHQKLEPELLNMLIDRKAIIVFDDWQWADDASRTMLRTLIAELKDQSILVLFTVRGNETIDEALLDLEPLLIPNMNAEEVFETAEKLLGWKPEEKLNSYIFNKSGGNPFFVEEICHLLKRDSSSNSAKLTGDDLPGSMQAMMVSRFEDLDPAARKIVEVTAVYGDGLDIGLLEVILGEEVNKNFLRHLVEIGLLSPRSDDGPLYFKHGITFDIIYSTISLAERRELHSRFAEMLRLRAGEDELATISEQLAFHYRGAGEYFEAVTHAVRAGDKAISLSSLDRAIAQYGTALELIDQCEPNEENRRRWLMVAMRWGMPCIYAPSREQIPVLLRAVRLAREFNDNNAMAVVNHWIGYIQFVIGDHADAIKRLTSAEELARICRNPRMEVDIIATRGFVHAARCDYIRAQRDIESALDAKNRNPGDGRNVPIISSYSRATLAVVKADLGDFAQGHLLIKVALDSVKHFNHEIESSICNMGAAVLLWQGRWIEALDLADRSCQRSEIVNSPYLINMARCLYGYANWRAANDEGGLNLLSTSADRLWNSEMRLYSSFCYGWVSDACVITGRREEALSAAERTITLAQFGDPVGAAMACRSLGMLAASEVGIGHNGQYERAISYLEDAYSYAEKRNSPHEHAVTDLHLARLNAVFGKEDIALNSLTKTSANLGALDMIWHKYRCELMEKEIREGLLTGEPSRILNFVL